MSDEAEDMMAEAEQMEIDKTNQSDSEKAKQYRKKPVVIEAMLLDESVSPYEVAKWCGGYEQSRGTCLPIDIIIPTLEGEMKASKGDYIIKGVHGEFYPCKPDIFNETYEPVEELNRCFHILKRANWGVWEDGSREYRCLKCDKVFTFHPSELKQLDLWAEDLYCKGLEKTDE